MTAHAQDALAFGPGLPPSGSRGTLALDGAGLTLRVGDAVRTAPLSALRLREVGFGRPGLELAWESDGEQWAAHVLDSAAAARLLVSAPLAGSPQALALGAARRRRSVGRTLGWSAVALFVLAPVLALVAFVLQADRLAEWATRRIPVETELRLGRAAFADLRRGLQLVESGPAVDAVQSLGRRLTAGSKYDYEFHVARDDSLNAFALPGGIIVVHTGLIAATSRPEELAGVLAHEVQHVEQRHSLEAVAKQFGLRALWVIVTGDVGGTLASEAALQLTSLRFSRDAEVEADVRGFDLLVARGIDPTGMPAFFETMQERAGAEPPALLSTHPASDDRSRALAARAAALQGRTFEPLDYGKWPPP